MSSHHDYAAPDAFRDQNLERDTSAVRPPTPPARQSAPRLALWLSIIAGIILVVGLCYAIVVEAGNARTTPSGGGPAGSITAHAQ